MLRPHPPGGRICGGCAVRDHLQAGGHTCRHALIISEREWEGDVKRIRGCRHTFCLVVFLLAVVVEEVFEAIVDDDPVLSLVYGSEAGICLETSKTRVGHGRESRGGSGKEPIRDRSWPLGRVTEQGLRLGGRRGVTGFLRRKTDVAWRHRRRYHDTPASIPAVAQRCQRRQGTASRPPPSYTPVSLLFLIPLSRPLLVSIPLPSLIYHLTHFVRRFHPALDRRISHFFG